MKSQDTTWPNNLLNLMLGELSNKIWFLLFTFYFFLCIYFKQNLNTVTTSFCLVKHSLFKLVTTLTPEALNSPVKRTVQVNHKFSC